MAKKSNKTEQVLKLITKEGEEPGISENTQEPDVEISVLPPKKQDHKVEAKLKIEIEPEIQIKQKEAPHEELHINVPVAPLEKPCEGPKRCLINLTEMLVREKAKEVMDRLGVCDCPACTQDVLALAMNSLSSKYVTTDSGRQHLLLEIYKKQAETDIIAALTRAGVRVKVSPHHGE